VFRARFKNPLSKVSRIQATINGDRMTTTQALFRI
jgi:hypothetical protein